MTWDNQRRNQLRKRTLSNGYVYYYMLDNKGIVRVYERKESTNIHEIGENYDNRDRERPDWFAQKYGIEQAINDRDLDTGGYGREQAGIDKSNYREISNQGESDRRGNRQNVFDDYSRTEEH